MLLTRTLAHMSCTILVLIPEEAVEEKEMK